MSSKISVLTLLSFFLIDNICPRDFISKTHSFPGLFVPIQNHDRIKSNEIEKQISQKQLQKDEIFKNVPIVRKNMQGIDGVELMPSEYNHLMDLAKADVHRLEFALSNTNQQFVNEKDVENKLIKPLK